MIKIRNGFCHVTAGELQTEPSDETPGADDNILSSLFSRNKTAMIALPPTVQPQTGVGSAGEFLGLDYSSSVIFRVKNASLLQRRRIRCSFEVVGNGGAVETISADIPSVEVISK
jgi:hypothetical protein